jgi:isopentenyl-diphosphate Delta-isomerase
MRSQPLSYRSVSKLNLAIAKARAPREDAIFIPGIAADGALFPIEKMEAHRMGALHLAVSVFVMAGDSLLIQRRALSKYHCGGLWANTCCSHPAWGETPEASAERRLGQELGVKVPLRACNIVEYSADVTNGLRECERVHVFHGEVETPWLPVTLNPEEVSEVRWMTVAEIQRDLRVRAEVYAPWFQIYLARWRELGLY